MSQEYFESILGLIVDLNKYEKRIQHPLKGIIEVRRIKKIIIKNSQNHNLTHEEAFGLREASTNLYNIFFNQVNN